MKVRVEGQTQNAPQPLIYPKQVLHNAFLLQPGLVFLNIESTVVGSNMQGDASRRPHLAVIYYVPNEQMKCLITALWK